MEDVLLTFDILRFALQCEMRILQVIVQPQLEYTHIWNAFITRKYRDSRQKC